MDNANRLNRPELSGKPERTERERERACHAAVRFARMWGVMETLGKLPPMRAAGEKESACGVYEELVLAWAEEYAARGDNDFVSFFEQKMDTVKSGGI